MNKSILNKLSKYSFTTFNRPTLLQSLRSYKNSAAQAHLHNYVRNEQQLQKTKKSKIDYEFITKQSAGLIMFRQFAFQQKTQQILVPHLNCYSPPSGSWSYEQVKKQLGQYEDLTKTQQQNKQILSECVKDIQTAISQYYANIGKKNYQFNLQQQINKINQMTDQQFSQFSKFLKNNKNKSSIKQQPVKQSQNQNQNQFIRKKYY